MTHTIKSRSATLTWALLITLLIIALCFAAVYMLFPAQYCWTFSDGGVAITECRSDEAETRIPTQILFWRVTEVREGAFDSSQVQSVSVPADIPLGTGMFAGCETLRSVTLEMAPTEIPDRLFEECTSLESVVMASATTDSGEDIFFGQQYGSRGAFAQVRTIGAGAFAGCENLTSLGNLDRLTTIGNEAFSGCQSLKDFTLPAGIEALGSDIFAGCQSLEKLTITQYSDAISTGFVLSLPSCTRVEPLFYSDELDFEYNLYPSGKIEILEYTGSDAVVSIPGNFGNGKIEWVRQESFKDNGNVACIVFADTISYINKGAMTDMENLRMITLPSQIREFNWSYGDMSPIRYYEDENGNAPCVFENIYISGSDLYKSVDGVLFTADMTELVRFPQGRSGSYTVPEGTERIAHDAFQGSRLIEEIVLPDSIKEIEAYAFDGCVSLSRIALPDKLKTIGSQAFRNCRSLTALECPDSLSFIGDGAFTACTSLSEVALPDSQVYLGSKAFSQCTALEQIFIPRQITLFGQNIFYGCENLVISSDGTSAQNYAQKYGHQFILS